MTIQGIVNMWEEAARFHLEELFGLQQYTLDPELEIGIVSIINVLYVIYCYTKSISMQYREVHLIAC